jgi:hypothetical protein
MAGIPVAVLRVVRVATGTLTADADSGTLPGGRRVAPRPNSAESALVDASSSSALPSEGSVDSPVTVGLTFTAATLGDTNALPPDPGIAAGPGQVVVVANGRIRSLSRVTGAADGVLNTSLNTFFASVRGTSLTLAPRIRFDRLSARWFVTAATDAVPGRILIASSSTATLATSTVWSFFAFNASLPAGDCAIDSPTLGVDASALYIGVNEFCASGVTYAGTSGFVVRKSSLVAGALPVVTAFHNLTGSSSGAGPFAPLGADNDDPAATMGYFIGVDNASLGTLVLRRVSTPGGTPAISANVTIAVAQTAAPISVRHLGNLGGSSGLLDGGDDRLTSAMIRNGRLWTAQTVGVLHTGQASGSATRDGVRWYELGSLDQTPSVVQWGTLYSTATPGGSDERNYWMPSIAASTRGRVVLGFNTAGTQEFANAGLSERLTGDSAGTLRAPTLYTTATAAYNPPGDAGTPGQGRRWGSRSDTVADSCDGTTIWSVQQFTNASDSYALQVARVQGPGPAMPLSISPAVVASGVASVDLTVTVASGGDTALYDTGSGFLCRLSASIPGVTVNSVTLTGPTTATVNISTVSAVAGMKAVTLINPDGQSASSGSILRVLPGVVTRIESPVAGSAGQPFTVRGFAVDGAATSGTGVDVVHVYAYSSAGTPTFLGAATYGLARPDIAAQYGAQFSASGFTLTTATVLPAGSYTIVVYARSTVANAFSGSASVVVTGLAPSPPFGVVDTPANGAVVAGEMAMTGWALDDGGAVTVDIYRSPVAGEGGASLFVGRAVSVRGARPDVQAGYPNVPGNDSAGWGLMILTNMLPGLGNGTYDFQAIATDSSGLRTQIGTRRVTAANGASSAPFGTIDTPGQGETVSGTIVNFGWALVAQPRVIPTNGSTIDVYVDGVMVGHPVYNNARSDIAALFPGLANASGPVGYFMLDTTTLVNGLHTISWVIRDNTGQGAGVGSRFFRVQNGS